VLLVTDRTVADLHLASLMQADRRLDPPVVLISDHARGTDLAAAFHGRHLPTDMSDRELEVLALLARGLTTEQMAEELVLSIHTVRNHIRSVMAKLDAHTRLAAVVVARRRGLLDDQPLGLTVGRTSVATFSILGWARGDLNPHVLADTGT
jgi:DNA-binding CsgD family transcriptional regulator